MIEEIIAALILAVLISDVVLLVILIPEAIKRARITREMQRVLDAMVKHGKKIGALPEDSNDKEGAK